MSFFRLLQHLLPDGRAWKPLDRTAPWSIGDPGIHIGDPGLLIGGETGNGRQLERLLKGLLTGGPARVREFLDAVWAEQFPLTTSQLDEWERELGIFPRASDSDRRADIADELRVEDAALDGGQSPSYLQDKLQARGFNVYVHEWWASGPPYVARDPRNYTNFPLIGTNQCIATATAEQPQCTGFDGGGNPLAEQPQCNRFLANDPGYLVNKDLAGNVPPLVPSDAQQWPYFLYIAGATFPNPANVSAARRDEFERLLLKLRPTQHWIVTIVNYV